MVRTQIISSNIVSIGYDKNSKTLEIEFLNGSIYQYFDLEENVFADFMKSNSKGSYYATVIKGFYRYSRI